MHDQHFFPFSYSQVIADHPLALLVGCAVLLLGCSVAGLLIGPLPDFSDPLQVNSTHNLPLCLHLFHISTETYCCHAEKKKLAPYHIITK